MDDYHNYRIRKEDNPHLNPSLWGKEKKSVKDVNDRPEGWGMIWGAAASMIAWGILASMGHDVTPGVLFGSMGLGAWKVYRNGRW